MNTRDPMSARDPMGCPTRDELALSARDAVRTTAPADRPRFVAALAFRLAELGHAKAVTVQVAGTAAAFEAVRSFLADSRRGASQAEGAFGPFWKRAGSVHGAV
jgi:hypothetical protein